MKFLIVVTIFVSGSASIRAQNPAPAPDVRSWDWATATPESRGMSSNRLESFWADLKTHRSTALLVIRNDAIVFERYAGTNTAKTKHFSASMAKALVGGVSAAIALTDERISLDDRASKFIPQWADDAEKSRITLRQLGSHTSGLSDAEDAGMPHDKLSGWKGDFWKRLAAPDDPFTIARDKAPVLFAPGSNFQYSNPGLAMLGYAITAAIKNGPQKDLRTLLLQRVMRPIGVPDNDLSIGYGQTVQIDGLPLVATWGGGNFTPRSVARMGRLMLRNGNWQGQQLIAASAVEAVTRDAGTPKNCGVGWWSDNDGTVEKLPRDAFWGSGAGHQVLLVIPSLNFIAVRNGDALNPAKNYDDALREHFFEPLMLTFAGVAAPTRAPVPASPVIKGIEWSSRETILRKARGSDNWPLTWGDDDAQYTAYGDGNGFEPFVEKKLSLGLAKILGAPTEFSGINIRSSSIEQIGEGKAGRKASGILMVEGVLYLWARNAGNSQLAWSSDHGASWTWAGWKFEKSFGCPTFLNFGKNYAGARDDYVYVYSADSENAYDSADRFFLARVLKTEIRNRKSYDYFKQLDETGHPIWTKNLDERGAVFTHPGQCYRSGITCDAALKRYLWCQILPGSTHPQGPRFQGGFGIYDAPEPWGPWTTVFFTDAWDVGPGESSSFPTKWMSADGKTVNLVFSGEDHFSVRKAILIMREIAR